MGMLMSLIGRKGFGIPIDLSSQMMGYAIDTVNKKFVDKEIKNFEDFHIAIRAIFNTINAALPDKYYSPPSHKEIEDLFNRLQEANQEIRKKEVTEFMKRYVIPSKGDSSLLITGIVAPLAAIVVKRTGQSVPQLSVMKSIPDVVFVPSATLLALIGVKASNKIFTGKAAS